MLKRFSVLISAIIVLVSCEPDPKNPTVHQLDLTNRTVTKGMLTSDLNYTTYLPIYSSVYAMSEDEVRALTSTVSIHNMNLKDSLFVKKIDYYDTEGNFVRSYIDDPIFVRPMETINIVVHQVDNVGGTGANFLIDWMLNDKSANFPLVEAVMISTTGQQGISFTSRGVLLDTPAEKKVEEVAIDTSEVLK